MIIEVLAHQHAEERLLVLPARVSTVPGQSEQGIRVLTIWAPYQRRATAGAGRPAAQPDRDRAFGRRLLGSPHAFIGSIEDLTQEFRELRERYGISSILVTDVDELASVVERLAST